MTSNFPNGHTSILRGFFTKFFEDNGVEAYYHTADNSATFPYITWQLRHIDSLSDDTRAKRYVMEINAYHKSSTLVLDNVLDFLEEKLDNMISNNNKYFINTNLIYNRLDIEDSREIKAKRINFEVKYYIKGC